MINDERALRGSGGQFLRTSLSHETITIVGNVGNTTRSAQLGSRILVLEKQRHASGLACQEDVR